MTALDQQQVLYVTTEFVLLEVADALTALAVRSHTVAFLNGLRRWHNLTILPATSALLAAGWALYGQRLDKKWSWTDCTSFVVMAQEQITEAVTSDHHFEQAGFVRLL